MTDSPRFTLARISIAANNIIQMAAFYNAVFDANLTPYEAYGTTLFRGELQGMSLVLAPNEMLGIQAEKNRIQFDFEVDNLREMVVEVLEAGGAFYGETGIVEEDGRSVASVVDPDGNTLVLIERVSA